MKKVVLLPYDRYQRLLSKEDEANNVHDPERTTNPEPEPLLNKERSIETQNNASETSSNTDTESDTLLRHFPKATLNRVRSILSYIRPSVTWNDRGEVTIEDREIPGSNIVDLIKVYLKDYKDFHPPGKEAFGEILLKLNVPKSLLAISARSQSGDGNLPPPPGIPVKRKVRTLPAKTVKWLRL